LGEMFGVGVGDQAESPIAEGELGVAEEGVVLGCDEPPGHLQDGVGGPGLDAGGEFLGLPFQFGAERLGHDGLLAWWGEIRPSFQTTPK